MIKIILLIWITLEVCVHIGILSSSDFSTWYRVNRRRQLEKKLKVIDKPFEFTKRMQWSLILWAILLIILLVS